MAGIQITIDCADPARLTRFWAEALDYVVEPPPDDFPTWIAYWLSRGLPSEELPTDGDAADSIVDPAGIGPRIWFQQVPETKVAKNRVHLDVDAGGGRELALAVRRPRIEAAAARLIAAGAVQLRVLDSEAIDHFAIVMQDPEGNEFCLH